MTLKSRYLASFAALCLMAAPALSADKQTIRPALSKPLQQAQTALQAKNFQEAQTQLNAAEAVGGLSSYESYVIARMKSSAAIGLNDYSAALASYDQVLASPELPASEQPQILDAYLKIAYAAKNYAKVIDAVQKYRAAGGVSAENLNLYAQSLYLSGKYQEAGEELGKQISALEAAGQRPTDTQLQLLASCALKRNDMAAYTASLEKLVTYFPKKETWTDLILRTAGRPGFAQNLDLDVYRLRLATGTLDRPDDYMDAAQLALQAGYPGEAQKFVDAGYAVKQLGSGGDASRHQRLKDLITKKIAEDKATLAEGEKSAAKQAAGDGLVSTGLNLVAYGQYDHGIELMEQGIKKGGLKSADQAQLHLGYAYWLAGKKEQAEKAFNTVSGTDGSKDLARMWVIQTKHPAA
jgi:tetratricopeptide (TPR) repeat protein